MVLVVGAMTRYRCDVCGRVGSRDFDVQTTEQLALGGGFGGLVGPILVRCSARRACRRRRRELALRQNWVRGGAVSRPPSMVVVLEGNPAPEVCPDPPGLTSV